MVKKEVGLEVYAKVLLERVEHLEGLLKARVHALKQEDSYIVVCEGASSISLQDFRNSWLMACRSLPFTPPVVMFTNVSVKVKNRRKVKT